VELTQKPTVSGNGGQFAKDRAEIESPRQTEKTKPLSECLDHSSRICL